MKNGNNSEFDGIAFTNLPDRVPLVHGLPSDHPVGTWAYYRLPANARLELIGNIQGPLEVNIKPAPWTRIEEE